MCRDTQCYNLVRKVKNSWMPDIRWVQCNSMENFRSIHVSFYTNKPLHETASGTYSLIKLREEEFTLQSEQILYYGQGYKGERG